MHKVINEKKEPKEYNYVIKNVLPKTAPILIPKTVKIKDKNNKYHHIFYIFERFGAKYEARWHPRTPNSPKKETYSWGVEKRTSVPNKSHKVLIKSKNRKKWIDNSIKQEAIANRNKHQSRLILNNIHWKEKKIKWK